MARPLITYPTIYRGSLGMNKQDLIATVADSSGLTKGDASKAVEAVFDAITTSLKKGGEVRLVGFGTFSVSKRKASTRSEEHTSELQSLMRTSYAVFCLQQKNNVKPQVTTCH